MGKFSNLFKSKNKDTSVSKVEAVTSENTNYWVCPQCGTRNSKSSLSCKDCGKYR